MNKKLKLVYFDKGIETEVVYCIADIFIQLVFFVKMPEHITISSEETV